MGKDVLLAEARVKVQELEYMLMGSHGEIA